LVSHGADSDAIYAKAREMGMKSLYESGLEAALRGITTPDEVARVVVRSGQ
jgi:type II secretory ATPase GspE/PulE/Tfp pilus assembly ATPase PilB-like protein